LFICANPVVDGVVHVYYGGADRVIGRAAELCAHGLTWYNKPDEENTVVCAYDVEPLYFVIPEKNDRLTRLSHRRLSWSIQKEL
jgi:hypothetical protein